MTTAIHWFSGTGNSLALARGLAKRLGGAELIPIARALRNSNLCTEADRAVIVSPVYMFGLPRIVVRFLQEVQPGGGSRVHVLVNCDSQSGAAAAQAEEILKSRGIQPSGIWTLKMPGNYTPLAQAASEEKQRRKFEKASARLDEIAGEIRDGSGTVEREFLPLRLFARHIVYPIGSRRIPAMDKGFAADPACTGCRRCARVCPVGNIRIVDGKPEWQGHCEQCFACLQWCPVEAIQYGSRTRGKRRYRHPGITPDDIALQGAEGEHV